MTWAWEMNFLETLGKLNQNPSLRWLSWILNIFTLSCDKGLICIILTIILLCFKKTRKTGIVLTFGLIVFAVLFNNVIIKYSFHRIRPLYNTQYPEQAETLFNNVSYYMLKEGTSFLGFFEVPDKGSYSFMSGHSFSSFLCATIVFMYHKKSGIVAYVVAAIIAFSRLYFGVHYPTDVLCGAIFGTASGIACFYMAKKWYDPVTNWVKKLFTKKKDSKQLETQEDNKEVAE